MIVKKRVESTTRDDPVVRIVYFWIGCFLLMDAFIPHSGGSIWGNLVEFLLGLLAVSPRLIHFFRNKPEKKSEPQANPPDDE